MMEKAESAQERGLIAAGMSETAAAHGEAAEAVRREKKARRRPDDGTEFCGVRRTPSGKYRAQIWERSRRAQVCLGTFGTAEEAAGAYDAAVVRLRGAARTNLEIPAAEEPDDMGEQGKRKSTPEGGAADGEGPMKQEMEWQEAMQRWFVEAIEKREQDRVIREEAWRRQEMARLAREQGILAQERAMAATRNAAELSIIPMPSITELPIRFMPPPAPLSQTLAMPTAYAIAPPPSSQTQATPTAYAAAPLPSSQTHASPIAYASAPPPSSQPPATTQPQEPPTMPPASWSGGGGAASSSPWTRAEVRALIQLRNNLDMRRKGPMVSLWDDVSAGMHRMGYIRSSLRCMQKWRRINNYFKKVKESTKKRPEVSKKCPFYFHLLEALSRDKAALGSPVGAGGAAAEHANAAPQDRIETSSGQNMPMPPIAAPAIRFMPPPPPPPPPPSQIHATTIATDIVVTPAETPHDASGSGGGGGAAPSSPWSKEEVDALIQLRCNQDTRRKRVSWEEISAGMRRMGYSRSSKRCVRKWENMNYYFKKTMERNEKRPDVSRTCPSYFHQLEALYRNKAALGSPAGAGGAANAAPQDRVEAAPISQRAPPLYILPPVAKNGVTREMDFTHAVA